MPTPSPTSLLDAYFLETRSRLLDIAATLDRIDRANSDNQPLSDPRLTFIHEALTLLHSSTTNRAEQIQQLYSK